MAATSAGKNEPGLRRVLGTRDLVLFNIAAIVALRWLSMAAQVGPSSLLLWLLGLVGFFIPLALAVLELSSRVPGEGGLYLWSKAAFGDMHGFIAGWTYWVSNLVYFPFALLFSAGIFLHVGGDRWLAHAGDGSYHLVYCLTVLWAATGLGILGLERAKWLQNIGGIATWSAAALILAAGALAAYRFGPATTITAANVMPDFGKLATFSTFATMALAFQGLELGLILGGEIKDPRRQIPRATLISCVVIAAIYIAGTASLLIALPASTIDIIAGIRPADRGTGHGRHDRLHLRLGHGHGAAALRGGRRPLPARRAGPPAPQAWHAPCGLDHPGHPGIAGAGGGIVRRQHPRGLHHPGRHDRDHVAAAVALHPAGLPAAAPPRRRPQRRRQPVARRRPGLLAGRAHRLRGHLAGDRHLDDPTRQQQQSRPVPAQGGGRLGAADRHRADVLPPRPAAARTDAPRPLKRPKPAAKRTLAWSATTGPRSDAPAGCKPAKKSDADPLAQSGSARVIAARRDRRQGAG